MSELRDTRDQGWFWADRVLVKRDGAILTPYGIAVYVTLCAYAGQGQTAWPSHATIAKNLGCSRSKVIQAIHALEDSGWVRVEKRTHADGDPDSNKYYLLTAPEGGSVPGTLGVVHPVHQGSVPGTHEVEPLKKSQLKKKEPPSEKTGDEILDDEGLFGVLAEERKNTPASTVSPLPPVKERIRAAIAISEKRELPLAERLFSYYCQCANIIEPIGSEKKRWVRSFEEEEIATGIHDWSMLRTAMGIVLDGKKYPWFTATSPLVPKFKELYRNELRSKDLQARSVPESRPARTRDVFTGEWTDYEQGEGTSD